MGGLSEKGEKGGGGASTQEEYLVVSYSNIPFFFLSFFGGICGRGVRYK